MTHLFCYWKFLSLNLPHLFLSFPHPFCPLATICFMYVWLFLFSYVCLFCFLDFTYKWNYTIFVVLWLISLSIILSRSIYVVANGKISFFFMDKKYSIVCIYHIFFIHSSVGHLGCSHILAIVNNVAVNIGVHICFWNSVLFSLDKYPAMELLGHMVVLFVNVWGVSRLFSIVVAPIYIPTSSAWGFCFLYILTNTCYLLSLILAFWQV